MTVLSETPINKARFEYIIDYNDLIMKIIYNSVGDLPISKYLELQKVLSNRSADPNEDDTDLNIEMLSIFTGECVEDIYNSSLFDVGVAMSELRTKLEQPMPNPNKVPKTLKINGVVYKVTDGVENFTVAQYIDFQQFITNDSMIAELLATFILPKGAKYNDGSYDIDKQIADFKEYLTIGTAVSLRFFFLKKLLTSTTATLQSLQEQMMRKQMKAQITQMMKENRLRMNEAVRAILRHIRGSH